MYMTERGKINMKIRKKPALIAIVIALFFIFVPVYYLYNGNLGIIARDSIAQTINRVPSGDHIVKVYSGHELIYQFEGSYTVEQYQGYYVILDFVTDEEVLRLNVYGNSTITDVPIAEESHAVKYEQGVKEIE